MSFVSNSVGGTSSAELLATGAHTGPRAAASLGVGTNTGVAAYSEAGLLLHCHARGVLLWVTPIRTCGLRPSTARRRWTGWRGTTSPPWHSCRVNDSSRCAPTCFTYSTPTPEYPG